MSGAKFYYLRNEAALLELALINYTMHKVVAAGFTPMMTPDLVRESVFEKCGFQPRGQNTQVRQGRTWLVWVAWAGRGGAGCWRSGGWDGMGWDGMGWDAALLSVYLPASLPTFLRLLLFPALPPTLPPAPCSLASPPLPPSPPPLQIYSVRDTALCLTGTAEIPLGGVAMDKILSEAQLPLKMAAYGHCFRTEAGAAGSGAWRHCLLTLHAAAPAAPAVPAVIVLSRRCFWCSRRTCPLPRPAACPLSQPLTPPSYRSPLPPLPPSPALSPPPLSGAASKGLYRVHQFSKVEMFVVCTPEQSEALHQQLLDLEVDMFTELGLHFQVGV